MDDNEEITTSGGSTRKKPSTTIPKRKDEVTGTQVNVEVTVEAMSINFWLKALMGTVVVCTAVGLVVAKIWF